VPFPQASLADRYEQHNKKQNNTMSKIITTILLV